jgi:hypothetical protein
MFRVPQDIDQKKRLRLHQSMYFCLSNVLGILGIIQIRLQLPLELVKSLPDGPAFCLANSLHGTGALPIKISLLHPVEMEPQKAVRPNEANRLFQHYISTVRHLGAGRCSIWSERWESLLLA